MPSVSKAQQRFMGLVHAYKKGEVPASKVSKAVKDAAKSMKKKSTKKFASTKHDDLPNKVRSENMNEDGHTDVASAERKLKLIMKDAMDTLNALRNLSNEDSLPSWWTDKITLAKDYVGKSRDYIMNPAESVNEESKTIKSIQNLADKNKYGTVSGTRMNGKTAKEIIAIYNHPKMKSFRGKMDKLKSHELMDLTIRLPKMLGIKVESVNEGKGVEKILKMASEKSFGKIAGRTVDGMTAGLFKAVYDKAPQNSKDKIDKMSEKQLYVFMGKLWNKFGRQVKLS